MNWYLEQIFGIIIVALLVVAVVWEVEHIGLWIEQMSGNPANWLREHAYEYVGWMFGTHFGWTLA